MMSKVETELYRDFSTKFNLFTELNTSMLREIRMNIKFSTKRVIFKKNDDLSCLILVIEGEVNL